VYRRALVPLDGSVVAEGALSFIRQVARPLDLDVTLLCVVVPSPLAVVEGGPVVIDDGAQLQAKAEAYLASLATELRASGVRVSTEVRRGEAAAEILAGVRETGADLIVMTTHGRTGFGRLLLGSVAEAVLRQAGVPVILMRQAASSGRRA
jgi:nucleotide-binding universal stress UspA family protein